jgi:hypothetical protein
MSCDYYILQQLKIHYKNDKSFSIIELSNEKGYFYKYNIYDEEEDKDYYNYNLIKYYDEQLISKKTPIIIYSNGKFKEDSYEKNYIEKINKIIKTNNKNMNDILEITKIETRIKN